MPLLQQAENSNDAGGTSIAATFAANTLTGSLIALGVAWTTAAIDITSVTISAGAATFQAARAKTAHSGNADFYQIWYAEGITGGATPTVTVTFSGSATFRRVAVHEVSRVRTSGSLDQTAGATADAGTTLNPGNVTTVSKPEYLFAGGTSFVGGTFTPGAGWTARATPGVDNFTQDRHVTALGTYSTSFTLNADGAWVAQAATFIESSGDAISADYSTFPKPKIAEAVLRGEV